MNRQDAPPAYPTEEPAQPVALPPHLQAALNRLNAVAERIIARNPQVFRDRQAERAAAGTREKTEAA